MTSPGGAGGSLRYAVGNPYCRWYPGGDALAAVAGVPAIVTFPLAVQMNRLGDGRDCKQEPCWNYLYNRDLTPRAFRAPQRLRANA